MEYTYSKENIGMPKALNIASKLSRMDYILISHDDFYYCPGWDTEFSKEIELINHKNFYLSGIMIGAGQNFLMLEKLLRILRKQTFEKYENIKTFNFQGTTKCPGLVHKDIWNKVGGWSEEFLLQVVMIPILQ